MGEIGLLRLGEINPAVLGIAVDVWIMRRSRPKPPERVMVKPKLGRRNPCKINPPECFMIDPRKMFIPKISVIIHETSSPLRKTTEKMNVFF